MKNPIFSIILLCSLSILSNAQTQFSRDYDIVNEANNNSSHLKSLDGGIVILSEMFSTISNATTSVGLTKTDATGNIIWEKRWAPPTGHQQISNLVSFPDSTYLFADWCETSTSELIISKVDKNGSLLYHKKISIPTGFSNIAAPICFAMNDGRFVIAGTLNDIVMFEYMWFLFCFDENGNLLWTKYYNRGPAKLYARDIDTLSDGDFILLSDGYDSINSVVGLTLLKITGNGNLVWSKKWSTGSENRYVRKLEVMPGNFLFVSGWRSNVSQSTLDTWVTRFTGAGNEIWTLDYSYAGFMIEEMLDVNHHLLVMGQAGFNVVLFEIDSAGVSPWAKSYFNIMSHDIAYSSLGGYTITGQSSGNGMKLFSLTAFGDACVDTTIDLAKTSANLSLQLDGNQDTIVVANIPITETLVMSPYAVTTYCLLSGIEETQSSIFSLFPNPANDLFQITGEQNAEHYEIYDVTGKKVQNALINSTQYTVDISHLPARIYFVRLYSENHIESRRLIIE